MKQLSTPTLADSICDLRTRKIKQTFFNQIISFSYFCGLHIDDICPDHSTISRFRTAMTKAGAYELLFKEINK